MGLSPAVLILASRFDLTCDYVVAALHPSGTAYLRLNAEDLPLSSVSLDPIRRVVSGCVGEVDFLITPECLEAVYFRQPVFLRETAAPQRSAHENFARAQWASFIRSFLLFDRCRWMNHPSATYLAEHKAVQLHVAAELGFDVPTTIIANSRDAALAVANSSGELAIKGLDTVLVRDGATERFGYTHIVTAGELTAQNLAPAPTILQEALQDKLDLRVTVIGEKLWCASITAHHARIVGDWRIHKEGLSYRAFALPESVAARCIELVRHFNLAFGAIDLALVGERLFFLELNPTGEWAWLAEALEFPIAAAIARYLSARDAAPDR